MEDEQFALDGFHGFHGIAGDEVCSFLSSKSQAELKFLLVTLHGLYLNDLTFINYNLDR